MRWKGLKQSHHGHRWTGCNSRVRWGEQKQSRAWCQTRVGGGRPFLCVGAQPNFSKIQIRRDAVYYKFLRLTNREPFDQLLVNF